MACLHPIPALDFGIDPETGKHRLKLLPHRHDTNLNGLKLLYGNNLIMLPCGKCIECKKKKSSDWATRCTLESVYHENNYFITLTYDDAHYPGNPGVLKKDFQKFVRSLRDRGQKIRYFGAGERGETGDRMHLHIIIFGLILNDLKYYAQNDKGDIYYTSDYISSVWDKGYCIIGDFSFETARYTAGYTSGVDKKTLFTLSSRKPAIGYDYYYALKDKMYECDKIEIQGRSVAIPRSFDQLAEKDGLTCIKAVKEQRKIISELSIANERLHHSHELLDYVYVARADNIKAKTERRLKK